MEWAVVQWPGNDKRPESMSEAAGAAEVSGGRERCCKTPLYGLVMISFVVITYGEG